jgi:membrane-bound lytic murein transglycosylase A
MTHIRALAFVVVCSASLISACSTPGQDQAKQADMPLQALAQWQEDTLEGMPSAVRAQCKTPTVARLSKEWGALCKELPATDATSEWRTWFERRFIARPMRGTGAAAEIGTLTGYYEPLVLASRTKSAEHPYPIYRRPSDLLTLDLGDLYPALKNQRVRGRSVSANRIVPYHTRAEIEKNNLLAGNELLFLSDRADAFFLEIQGSGRAQLSDGSIIRIGYADQNGHPYRAIGRVLIDGGLMDRNKVTALSLKQWIRENPAQAQSVLHTNASLVFFRELEALPGGNADANIGPPGSLNVPLTPMRSIAVDPRQIPLGSLAWIQTSGIKRLSVAQDTGGAIIGAVRADLFTGFGAQAEGLASALNSPLQLYVLVPR